MSQLLLLDIFNYIYDLVLAGAYIRLTTDLDGSHA